MTDITLKDRYLGCLFGLAVADAIGSQVEFKPRGSFPPVTDMVGGGVHSLKAGNFTDDMSMALCVGQSLLDCDGFDAADQMNKYIQWCDNGYMSSTGKCFDIGNTVSSALSQYKYTGDSYAGSNHERSAGNGSIMRLAPIPMYYLNHPQLDRYASLSSMTTHGHNDCLSACVALSSMIKLALLGYDKNNILNTLSHTDLSHNISNIIKNKTYRKPESEIIGSGYVVESLEAALWAFNKGDSYIECILLSINLGDDADTTGAICGQLAGAYYGFNDIPKKWSDRITYRDLIFDMALSLYDANSNNTPCT